MDSALTKASIDAGKLTVPTRYVQRQDPQNQRSSVISATRMTSEDGVVKFNALRQSLHPAN